MQTKNIADKNFEILSKMFPNALTETITGYDDNGEPIVERAIDADALRQEISCKVVEGKDERYQFTWPDKRKAVLLANEPINKTLRPCREESINFNSTENIYIEGDNLEVLKLLQETYLGQIKMIYIDPPYNTGNDFVYEDNFAKGINHESRIFDVDDNLYEISNEMEQYKGYRVSEINPIAGTVTFTNGEVIHRGDVVGDVSEKDMRRVQIRETIKSHLEKEEELFNRGIKTLSLFFIDEVAKYRQYDEDGEEILGEYGQIFEQEYNDIVNEYITVFDTPYQKYLKGIDVKDTHKGYFSIDKKGHAVDSTVKRGSDFSDDISAYDLILKNKERLLSFAEPTRFIFSHSALREG